MGNREIESILQRGADGGRISPDEALLLYTDAPFHALGEAADHGRRMPPTRELYG